MNCLDVSTSSPNEFYSTKCMKTSKENFNNEAGAEREGLITA